MIVSILLLLLGIVVIALIIAANGFFVAQEFAYMSVDRSRLRARAAEGDAAATRALKITKRTSFMLSGAQLGITVTGLLVGYVAEPLVGEALGDIIGVAGVPAAVSITAGTVIALVVATVVQMIFGELFPKNLAIAAPEPLARALATPTRIYLAVFGWLIIGFDKSSDALLKLLRIQPVHDLDSSATVSDLEHIIDDSRVSGDLPDDLSLVLDRILDFGSRTVEHAMIPRARVDAVRDDLAVSDVRQLMATAHSRYPVIDADQRPIGVVHLLDVLAHPGGDSTATELMRRAPIIPTLMPLPDALGELHRAHSEMALVVDEYGGFAGILTVEDLAEELMGEIVDEHDDDTASGILVETPGAVWIAQGNAHLDEVERATGRHFPRGDFETIAGLLIAVRGAFPEQGECVPIELPTDAAAILDEHALQARIDATVLEIDNHVPARVELVLILEEPDERVAELADTERTDADRADAEPADVGETHTDPTGTEGGTR